MTERDHREDRQADELPVAARGVDHEPAERRLTTSARRIVGDRSEPMVHVILEVNPLRDDLASQQRCDVIPGVASKLQREARHWQAPFMEKQLEAHVGLLWRDPQGLSMRAAP